MVNQSAGDFEVFVSFKVCTQNIVWEDMNAKTLVKFQISLQVGATSLSVLRSVWQVYWLHENRESFNNLFDWLSHSLLVMEDRFDDFIQQLKGAGWDTHQLNLKVPKEISIDEVGPLQWSKSRSSDVQISIMPIFFRPINVLTAQMLLHPLFEIWEEASIFTSPGSFQFLNNEVVRHAIEHSLLKSYWVLHINY